MGRDAMFRVVLGIKFQDVEEELEKIYDNFPINSKDYTLKEFLSDNSILYGYAEGYDEDHLVGISTYYQDWESGFVELEYIETEITPKSFSGLMKEIEDLVLLDDEEKNELDISELKDTLKEMMDCARVYAYCDYW